MNREDIDRLAREAEQYADKFCSGIGDTGQHHWFDAYNERFAALAAEWGAKQEREACAKVCDGWLHANGDDCAAAIRARGEQEQPR